MKDGTGRGSTWYNHELKYRTWRHILKVRVDREKCIGAGNCLAIAPTVFDLDEEYKAVVLDALSVDDDTLLEAAKSCPVEAIILEDDAGHQVYP
jgi:ferredoxin